MYHLFKYFFIVALAVTPYFSINAGLSAVDNVEFRSVPKEGTTERQNAPDFNQNRANPEIIKMNQANPTNRGILMSPDNKQGQQNPGSVRR